MYRIAGNYFQRYRDHPRDRISHSALTRQPPLRRRFGSFCNSRFSLLPLLFHPSNFPQIKLPRDVPSRTTVLPYQSSVRLQTNCFGSRANCDRIHRVNAITFPLPGKRPPFKRFPMENSLKTFFLAETYKISFFLSYSSNDNGTPLLANNRFGCRRGQEHFFA